MTTYLFYNSDNKAELKSAIDKYFGRDDDKPNPPPAKKKKTVCTKVYMIMGTHILKVAKDL